MRRETLDLLGGLLLAPEQEPAGGKPAPVAPEPQLDQQKLISPNSDVLRLLGDPLRAEIVRLLADGPACTSHLVADTGAKQPNVSGHLKLLREAGVVTTEPRGRFTFYRLVPESLQGAALHLADLAAHARANAENFRDC
ncbi:metalloregulator ArsR/SmtB family transcription factor [Wangella sp. NEAU-J3]|nr:metalloregulator ArsR/SmtB family transcription factor [Jidongwangia harbinensis]MCA2211564.1 metalloregulator ArsR/SmtB family transcription factor [Jidongwangia harbinensis]